LPPGAIFELKIHQNAYAAGALPRTPLGNLQSSQTPGWFSGSRFAAGEERKGEGKGGKEEKGRGSVPPILFYWQVAMATCLY